MSIICWIPSWDLDSLRPPFARAKLGVILESCDFLLQNFISVIEQQEPDPDFPTVKFPNPEEGKSALNLSFETADKNGSTIVLANDPDADRFAVAEKLRYLL